MHLDAAKSASGCIAHLDAGPFSGIFLHWHLDASLPCGIGIEMQALFLASQFKIAAAAVRQPRKKSPKINPLFFFALFYIPRMERSFFCWFM